MFFFQFDLRKILAVLLLISLPIFLFNSEGGLTTAAKPFVEVAHGVQGGLDYISLGVLKSVSEYTNLISIKKLNRQLLKEVSELKIEQVLNREIKLENDRLRKLLKLEQSSPMKLLASFISAQDIILSGDTLTLSKGEHEGVKEKMGVVGLNGVVGETLKISRFKSQVLTITNHFFATEGIVQRSRERILIEGDGQNDLISKHLPFEAQILEGDLIVTSGSSGVFPKGLPIGLVKKIKKTKSGITKAATIKPLVDLKNTEEFFIIINPGNPEKNEIESDESTETSNDKDEV